MAELNLDDTGCSEEIPYDGVDQDCDGEDLQDVDGDGWDAVRVGGDDCKDDDAAVHPAADEACDNLLDDDCDGRTDEDCAAEGAPDPGGIYWICGPALAPAPAFLFAAFLLVLGRRRR